MTSSSSVSPPPRCVVAIPANNEADLLPRCLAALAVQRDAHGSPLRAGTFSVLVLANNCTDDTVNTARRLASAVPYGLHVLDMALPQDRANAGGARKAAMDEAAFLLAPDRNGALLTTDADTVAAPTWVSANLEALAAGADAVAGYVYPDPLDYLALGPAFMARGRLEDTYLRMCNEIRARLDPFAHDPWPNHSVNSGASLAVVLQAYLDVGGVPVQPVGEDAALVRLLERAGRKVRHALEVGVTTSCRLEGRAGAGAAATMKARFEDPEAVCDEDMERAVAVARRASLRGRLRRWHAAGCDPRDNPFPRLTREAATLPFVDLWDSVEASYSRLLRAAPLRPRDLPQQITIARRLLARIRQDRPFGAEHPAGSVDDGSGYEPALSAA